MGTKIAKAQDAKTRRGMIEWFDGECLDKDHGIVLHGHSGRERRHCLSCWEEFKEEWS